MKCLSIDLESFAHINPHNTDSSAEKKSKDNGYIKRAVKEILEMLKATENKATFFILGEIYEWHPELIEEIKKSGHEIGYHSHTHRIIKNSRILAEEIKKSEKFIKEYMPKGFRAPQMFLTKDSLNVLKENGFEYDSSTYGKEPFNEIIAELPITTLFNAKKEHPQSLSIKNLLKLPLGSGFFFGILGSRTAIENVCMFIHPWQITKFPLKHKIKAVLRDPRLIPYLINRKKSFSRMLGRNRFCRFIDLLQQKSPSSLD